MDDMFQSYTSLLDDSQDVEIVSPIYAPPPPPQSKSVIRGKSFTIMEDEALCKSWLAVGQDSIIGNNQTMAIFWERIRVYFTSQPNVDPGRSNNSLTHRWAVIQKAISKFSGFYNQVQLRNQSGTGEFDKISEAKRMYHSIQRKHFTFDTCWEILRHSCKWDELSSSSSKRQSVHVSSPSTTSSTPAYESPTLLDSEVDLEQLPLQQKSKRPIGTKAEKERRRKKGVDDNKFQQLMDNDNKFVEYLSGMSSRQLELDRIKIVDREKRNEREKKKEEQREATLNLFTQLNEREQRKEEHIIMSTDMTTLTPIQKMYYEDRQREIMERRNAYRNL